MTKEEIVEQGTFILDEQNPQYSEFRIKLYIDFFKKEQEVLFMCLPSLNTEPQMTVITESINQLIQFKGSNVKWLKEKLWWHYNDCIETIEYPMVPTNGFENILEANKGYFKINNVEEAYNAARITEFWMDIEYADDPLFTDDALFTLTYSCPWEEHGVLISIRNNQFIDKE